MLNIFVLKSGLKKFTQLNLGFIPLCYLKIFLKITVRDKF